MFWLLLLVICLGAINWRLCVVLFALVLIWNNPAWLILLAIIIAMGYAMFLLDKDS
jgi:hypothetical protein